MKNAILITVGVGFLFLSILYGTASSPDYKTILIQCLTFNFIAILALTTSFRRISGYFKWVLFFLIVLSFANALQAGYRLVTFHF